MNSNDLDKIIEPYQRQIIFESLGFNFENKEIDVSGWVTGLYTPDCIRKDTYPDCAVNLKTGYVKDFGSSIYGSMYDIIMMAQNISFKESIVWVESQIIEDILLNFESSGTSVNSYDTNEILEFNNNLLTKNGSAKKLREYLIDRGINLDSIEHHKLGFNDSFSSLNIPLSVNENTVEQWKEIKFDPELLEWDFDEKRKKQIVTSGEITLYPLEKLTNSKPILLCEGELDAIIAQQEGFNAVTSTGGAGTFKTEFALTLKKYHDIIYIAYDGDEAGKEGAEKAAKILYKAEFKVRILDLPNDQDVGSIISNHGSKYLKDLILKAKEFSSDVSQPIVEFDPNKILLLLDSKWETLSDKQKRIALRRINRIVSKDGYSLNKII